ncbi:PucR family transcriptional regulator [Streptomyces sp. NPDC014864]|uniref:PucR family transcriptional regulator n=1 Tax=Streptomyces sp. NPDC014864 TaxID=3364924 RepID=UPI0036F60A39
MTVISQNNGVREDDGARTDDGACARTDDGAGTDDGLRKLVDVLLPGIDRFADLLTCRITQEEDAYRDHGHVKHDQLRTSCADNLHSMVTQLGRDALDLRVPHDTGRFKAEHGVPLSAVTHAYRLAGRFLWECVLSEAGDTVAREMPYVATAVWSVSDAFTDAVATAYRETMTERAHHDRQVRSLLLAALLDGRLDESTHLWECADALRLPQRGVFAVVSAECGAGARPADEGSLYDVEGALRVLGIWSVWRQEEDAQVGLLSLRSPRGLAQAMELIRRRGAGRVGVSTLFHGLEQVPSAFRQARLACACVEPGSSEVVSYGDSPVRLMVVSAPDSARHAVRTVLSPVLELPPHERDVLLETLSRWFASGGSATETAARMYCHRNTVTHRLRRVQELTGRSPADPVGASEIHLALEAHRLLTGLPSAGTPGL